MASIDQDSGGAAIRVAALVLNTFVAVSAAASAPPLDASFFTESAAPVAPLENAAFAPSAAATRATPLSGVLSLAQTPMTTWPTLAVERVGGRDVRRFPALDLTLYSDGDVLVPVERGRLVAEKGTPEVRSYWHVIAGFGRVWREPGEGAWQRAALPLTLVNDTENHAHQGLAMFRYRAGEISDVRLQFVQQTAPYLVKPHFVAAAVARAKWLEQAAPVGDREAAREERAARLTVAPWSQLEARVPKGGLEGFGAPLKPEWRVARALVEGDTLYVDAAATPWGPYPYPLEMRFGVRSVMKSIAAPLALLHLAALYGPGILDRPIGPYVPGAPPHYDHVRFRDAVNMASGFGGTGSFKTEPNDFFDGYLEGDYDAWYLAPSHAEKLAVIRRALTPYPWPPGHVARYRDQDFYLLGVALDGYLKSVRGPDADIGRMLEEEVLQPIGIRHAPMVRTQETTGPGFVWFNAGYYPTLDDLAKIAHLYQNHGVHQGRALLHRGLVDDLLAARGSLAKAGEAATPAPAAGPVPRYGFGFHYTPYVARDGRAYEIPTMSGSGENEVLLLPNGCIAIRIAKAAGLPEGTVALDDDRDGTIRIVEQLAPFP
jgi:hypothetical protein